MVGHFGIGIGWFGCDNWNSQICHARYIAQVIVFSKYVVVVIAERVFICWAALGAFATHNDFSAMCLRNMARHTFKSLASAVRL